MHLLLRPRHLTRLDSTGSRALAEQMNRSKRVSEALRSWRAILCVLFLSLGGCAVQFVAPYDAVFDTGISTLHQETNAFLAKMAAGGSYSSNRRFYQESGGKIEALRLRAELYGADKNKGTLRQLDLLKDSFGQLAELHQAGPLTGEAGRIARELINVQFRALLQTELAKKRSSGVSAPKPSE
jgi:hypothetical protein